MGNRPKERIIEMEDNKNTAAEKTAETEEFWGEGLPELREESIDIVLTPTVKVELSRYDDLLHSEAMLNAIIRASEGCASYSLQEVIRYIVGDKYPKREKKDGDDE